MAEVTFGSFERGVLTGVEVKGNFAKLCVRVVDSDAGFEAKIGFKPFDSLTGDRVLPDDLRVGDVVECRVFNKARTWATQDGRKGVLIDQQLFGADAVEVLIANPNGEQVA